jgi:hypothetical protein
MLQPQMVAAWPDPEISQQTSRPLHTFAHAGWGRINHKQKALIWMWPACNTGNNLIAATDLALARTQFANRI